MEPYIYQIAIVTMYMKCTYYVCHFRNVYSGNEATTYSRNAYAGNES